MSRRSFILFLGDDRWQLGFMDDGKSVVRELPTHPTIEARALGLHDTLLADGWDRRPILIALPSQWSLCASIDGASLPRRRRRETLRYRLEEELPVAAEDLVADFLPPDESNRVLGCCTMTDRLSGLVAAIEGAGIRVQSITPLALLAAQRYLQLPQGIDPDALLLRSADGTDLFSIRGRQIADWWHARRPDHVAVETVEAVESCMDDPTLALHRRLLSTAIDSQPVVEVPEASQETLAIEGAAEVLRGRMRPWIEFRRDALAAGNAFMELKWPLFWAAAAMLILGITSAGSILYRSNAYAASVQANDAALVDLYRQTMPGRSIPATPMSRLVSEERRLGALAGVTTETPSQASALRDLRDVLTSLPPDLRFKIVSLRIDDGKIDLRGKAPSHSDADAIANAIRAGGRFSIDTPRTEQAGNDGVGFSFSGRAIEHNTLAAAGKETTR